MKATRNIASSMNETTIENISFTQRNILLNALFEFKGKHLNNDSADGKIIVKEVTIMIDEIMGSMEGFDISLNATT